MTNPGVDERRNGNAKYLLAVRIIMFSLPLLIAIFAYYVQQESDKKIHDFREEVEDEFLSHEEFSNFVNWRYLPDQEREAESMEEIKDLVKLHMDSDQ